MHSGIVVAGDLSDDTKLYRYVSLSQFLSFVETHRTCLSRVVDWEDTWEVPSRRLRWLSGGSMHEVSSSLYGQCWSLLPESDAMWRIYSTNKEGLMLQTSTVKFSLMSSIRHGLLAPVLYYSDLNAGIASLSEHGFPDPFALAFLKRKAFEHEREVRLITCSGTDYIGFDANNSATVGVCLDPTEFIETVVIDPRADAWYVDAMRSYCRRAGFPFRPEKSLLYSRDPDFATGVWGEGEAEQQE